MNYLETVEFIRVLANEVNPTGKFIHGRRVDGSGEYAGNFPQILLEPFITSDDLVRATSTANISLGFMFQDSASNSMEQREELIGKADVLVRAFLKELNNTNGVNLSGVRIENKHRIPRVTYYIIQREYS